MVELEDMRLFVCAVGSGSLSAAGRELGFSPAVASKRLSRLEAALGVRLLQRSSRRLALTGEGATYYERCAAILADVDEAALAVSAGQAEARGRLHVSAPVDLGRQWIGPAAADFAAAHPELAVRVSLSDRLVDLFEAGVDVAVRLGALDDSRLVSRRLAGNRRVVCAAPAYLERRGSPRTLAELADHTCIVLERPGMRPLSWTFRTERGLEAVRVGGRLAADSGDLVRDWALAGHGLAFKSIWDVAADLAAGRLVPLLTDLPAPASAVHAITPSRRFVPARVRLFVDFLQRRFAAHEPAVLAAAAPRGDRLPPQRRRRAT
ncbi:LysR family transcriptional regulator [Sorangium cellulosum]|uniref:LysR family transcriptional regulator n=2 Tax=Sorangium cellulosum TaxID=56 RepID=A0A2L0F0F8_SORCE|nr:LysR family transcriptional regulator [Sorangium cellulosum]